MKKIAGIICLFLITSISIFAQGNKDKIREKVRAKKIAFISDKLALTSEEAQDFWPIYNSFKKKEKEIRKEATKVKRLEELSDAEVEAYIEQHLDKEAQLLAAKRAFVKDAKQILPIKKLAKLIRVERKFKEMMLEHSRSRRQG